MIGQKAKAIATTSTAALVLSMPFVAGWEGLRTKAYYDTGGVPTICYGETKFVYIGQTEDKETCDKMLQERLGEFLDYVDQKVTVPMSAPRHAALGSFTYNVGKRAFSRSTLLKKLNAGDTVGACNELRRWVYDNGRKLRGLIRRREAERKLCLMENEDVRTDANAL